MKLKYFVSIKLSQYHKNTYKYTGLCKISVGRVDVTFSSQVGGSVRNWSLTTVLGAKVRNVCCILAKLLHFRKITTENFSTLTTQLSGDFQHHKYTQSLCAIASASTRIFEDDTYFHFWNTVVSKNYYYAPNLDFKKFIEIFWHHAILHCIRNIFTCIKWAKHFLQSIIKNYETKSQRSENRSMLKFSVI